MTQKKMQSNVKRQKSVPFDTMFDHIGHFGTYQIVMFCTLSIVAFSGNETMFLNFVSFTPDHWCHVDELADTNSTTQKKVAIPAKEMEYGLGLVYSSCKMFGLNYSLYSPADFNAWDRDDRIDANTSVVSCQRGWDYDKSIVTQSIVTKWDLVCGSQWLAPLVGSICIVGFMIASLIVGPISDRFGRRPGIIFFLAIKITAGFMCAYAPDYTTLIIARFLLSTGSMGAYVLAFSILLEIVGPGYRSLTGMGFAIIYSFGFMAVAVIGYFCRDDVSIQLTMASLPCILIVAIWFVPESPRYLLLNGRQRETDVVLRTMARINKRKLPDDFNVSSISVEKDEEYNSSIMDIMRSPILRKRGAILCLHWFTDSLIFYALSLNTAKLSGDIYLNTFITGAVEIPANILAIVFMNWKMIGRRGTAVLSLVVAGLASLISVPIILVSSSSMAVTVLLMVGKAGATMGFNCVYIYTAELFPTEVRNIALGMCSFASRISGIAAPYVGGPLSLVWRPLPSFIFGTFGVFAGLSSLLLPETLGRNLPDTIYDVEREANEQAADESKKRRVSKKKMHSVDMQPLSTEEL